MGYSCCGREVRGQTKPPAKLNNSHLDNDRVGRQAAESIMGGLDKKYTVLNRPPRAGKDVNDYLRMEIVNRNGKERER